MRSHAGSESRAVGRKRCGEVEAIRLDDIVGTQPAVKRGNNPHLRGSAFLSGAVKRFVLESLEHDSRISLDGLCSGAFVGEIVNHPYELLSHRQTDFHGSGKGGGVGILKRVHGFPRNVFERGTVICVVVMTHRAVARSHCL